jgi:hypothetical protein
MTQNTKGVVSQKRGAEDAFSLPTLGQLVEEERFQPLREVLHPVAKTPVNELLSEGGGGLRNWLQEEAGKVGQLPVALAFFAACGVLVEAVTLKRAHVGSGEGPPGKQRVSFSFDLLLPSSVRGACSRHVHSTVQGAKL